MPVGRIHPKQNFHVVEETEVIHEVLTASGPQITHHEKIIKLLSSPNNAQRQQLVQQYRQKYGGADLVEELRRRLPPSEVATNQLLLSLLDPPAVHDAKYLHKAMKGLGTNEDALIEVLVNRGNGQLRQIKRAYQELYGHELAKDIIGDTSGTFKALLLDLLEANRDETFRTDPLQAKKDADALYKAGEKKLGTDEAVFIKIMANQNFSQLRLVFDEYERLTKHTMEQAVKAEFSGDDLNGLLTICSFVRNGHAGQVAELLHKCIQKGAKDETLVHLIIAHSELDLGDIAEEYRRRFNVPLEQAIESSGKSTTLKRALVQLIRGNQ